MGSYAVGEYVRGVFAGRSPAALALLVWCRIHGGDCVAVVFGCPVLARFPVALLRGDVGAAVWKLGAGNGRSPAALPALLLFLYILPL